MLTPRQAERILADVKTLPEELEEWRKALHITPSEAARRCKMSPQHWFQLARGERGQGIRIGTLRKLADGTGLPLERLLRAAELMREPVPA